MVRTVTVGVRNKKTPDVLREKITWSLDGEGGVFAKFDILQKEIGTGQSRLIRIALISELLRNCISDNPIEWLTSDIRRVGVTIHRKGESEQDMDIVVSDFKWPGKVANWYLKNQPGFGQDLLPLLGVR